MATDGRWRDDDGVARSAGGHEGVQVGHSAGADSDLGESGPHDLTGQAGGDDLDLFDGFQAHLVFLTWVTQRGP